MKWLFNFILLVAPLILMAEDVEVHGRVLSYDNVPIGGVNVIHKGSPNATVTDMNGYFRLSMPEGSAVLLFSFRKQKALEHPIEVNHGYQYQVDVVLSGKSQTFNRSRAITSALPLHAPKIIGTVRDQQDRQVAGAVIAQRRSTFNTTTDIDGRFVLPMPSGESTLNISRSGYKPLEIKVQLKEGSTYTLDAVLVEDRRQYRSQQSGASLLEKP